MRLAFVTALAIALLGAAAPLTAPKELDSQLVVGRYLDALAKLESPKNAVFTYSVSQAGLYDIEQTHRIFRGPRQERDETLAMDGDPVKFIRIAKSADRYAIAKLAPRLNAYVFLFLGTHRNGKHLDYIYSTAPLKQSGFTVTEVTIDGLTYLPSLLRFSWKTGKVTATGTIAYAKFSRYWVPRLVSITANVSGKATRERIVWSAYNFPAALPPSTFYQPKPLAIPSIAPF